MNLRRLLIEQKLKKVCVESIRTHFKFNPTQASQQKNVMMKLMKNNINLKRIMENKPIIVSKGSPNPLSIDEKGVDTRIITRRMKVLNKNFMQCITDVISTHHIGNDFKELEVRITQVLIIQLNQSFNYSLIHSIEGQSRQWMQYFECLLGFKM